MDQGDPRPGLAAVIEPLQALMVEVAADESNLTKATPCPEFDVAGLLDHIVFIARRVAVLGQGGHFADVPDVHLAGDWAEAFGAAADDIERVWSDPAKLDQSYTVPWAEGIPGAPLLMAYTSEFATHGWDLAQAVDGNYQPDEEALAGALIAVKHIPAEGRDDPMVPFGPVVDAPSDATPLEQIVAWTGRRIR